MRLGGLQRSSLIDYPDKICAIVFTLGCNFRCPYCHNPELVEETADEISVENFFNFLKTRVGLLDAVTITGGEPTLHDDLIQFITRIKELGFLVKLDSNGTRPEILKSIIDQKLVDYLAMDIKSPIEKYENTVNRPVDTDKIKESIELLLGGKVQYEFRTTVIKSMLSIDDFHEIGKMIKGANQYYLQRFVSTKILNPAFKRKTTYSEEEFKDIQAIMNQYVSVCHIR
jgi:pyruvate formate lyase activating enzyme